MNDLFPFADHEGIDKGMHGLGVHGGVPAGDDDGVGLVTILRADGDTGQVEHVEGVGIERLVGEGETDQVELGQRPLRFERIEGNAMLAHQRFHV